MMRNQKKWNIINLMVFSNDQIPRKYKNHHTNIFSLKKLNNKTIDYDFIIHSLFIKKMSQQMVYCEECYAPYFSSDYLVKEAACADTEVGYGDCCNKYICKNGCIFKCHQCLQTFNDVDLMFKLCYKPSQIFCGEELSKLREKFFICHECVKEKKIPENDIEPAKIWYGISNDEWIKRYN